jgi:hypothetical protein
MDEQLKQRLIGATIIVALSVIFVPMLFEDKDHPANSSVENVPALPEAIEERAIELPKTAADVVQQEKKEEKPAEAATGYRVIPLNDAPKPAKSSKSTKAARSAVEAWGAPPESGGGAPPAGDGGGRRPRRRGLHCGRSGRTRHPGGQDSSGYGSS